MNVRTAISTAVSVLLPAVASTAIAAPAGNTTNIPIPYSPSSSSDDASFMFVNPASLGPTADLQLFYIHDEYIHGFNRGDALALQLGWLGFGLQYADPGWAPGDYLKYTIPIGVPIGDYFALGAGIEIVQPLKRGCGNAVSWNVGALIRPANFISLSITGDNLGSPAPYGRPFRPMLGAGMGIRPIGEMLTLSGDFHYSADGTVLPGDFYLKVFPVKGFGIHAGMRTDLSWWAGIQFDFAHFGLGVSGAMDGRQRFAGMTYQLRASLRKYPAIYEGGNKVVVVRVNESLRAKTFFNFDPLGLSRRTFIDLIADINRAERDKSVGALLVKIEDSPLDLEEAEEIVRALERFKARGGRVFAYMDGGGNAEYLLASAAEAVFLNPAGVLLVGGLKAELTFFKGTLQKLDVKMQTIRAGKYKSFVEKFTRENASPENLEQLQAFIGDLNSEMAAQIAKGRRIEPAAVKELIDRGLFTAKEALEVKLVDAIAHEADLEKELEKRLGFSASLNEKYFSIQDRAVAWVAPPKIAVLRIEGSIVYGEGSPPFFGFGTTGSRDVCDAAREIEKSPFYKAVVLRIDSPGGSGLASEIMWKCISDLAAKKPVVVSMGSAAASGGYYTALPAAYIYADPFTLTGSIGVWGLKPNITGLALLLGITHQTVKLTKGADLYSLWRDLDDEEMARVQRYIDGFYEQFKARVSDGRKLKIDEVEKVAQGRVWSAKAALDAKLIDGIGGFEDALAKAKTLSGMDPKKPARLVEFPERPSILRTLKKRFMAVMDPVGAIRKELKDLGSPDASAELPYDVEIK